MPLKCEGKVTQPRSGSRNLAPTSPPAEMWDTHQEERGEWLQHNQVEEAKCICALQGHYLLRTMNREEIPSTKLPQ